MKDDTSNAQAAWWRHGHVWLVISGPAAVVVASLVTGWVAAKGQDPVIEEDYYRRGVEMNKTLATAKTSLPAMQARNHAATPPAAAPR